MLKVDAPLVLRPGSAIKPRALERVVVINDISVVKGGATSIALSGAKVLHARSIPVTFITGDDGRDVAPEYEGIGFETVAGRHILDGPRMLAATRGLYNREAAQFLRQWISRNDTPGTVYHLHGWSKILSPSVFHALRPVASRLLIHAHDFFLMCPNGGYHDFKAESPCERVPMSAACISCHCDRRSFAHKAWRVARHGVRQALFNLNGASRVLPVHDRMLPLLERGGIDRKCITVLRNPVVPWCSTRVRAEENATFLFVGRLEADKGVHLAVAAARRAGVPLRVIGTGPMQAELEARYPEVEFMGWQSREDIGRLCRDVRAIVMPSRWRETFGLVVFEALRSGIPAIVSDRVMIAKEIAERGFGLNVAPSDEDRFARVLSDVARDDAFVFAASEKGFKEADTLAPPFDMWADRLIEIYDNQLGVS